MNLMTVLPKLTREEKIWCAYLWWAKLDGTPCIYTDIDEDIPPHKLMFLSREVLLRNAKAVKNYSNQNWFESLQSLVRKLENEPHDRVA